MSIPVLLCPGISSLTAPIGGEGSLTLFSLAAPSCTIYVKQTHKHTHAHACVRTHTEGRGGKRGVFPHMEPPEGDFLGVLELLEGVSLLMSSGTFVLNP